MNSQFGLERTGYFGGETRSHGRLNFMSYPNLICDMTDLGIYKGTRPDGHKLSYLIG